MTADADSALIEDLRARLRAAADPDAAPRMRAYMKSDLPYYGVPAPGCRPIFREVLAAHPLPDHDTWLATVQALWERAAHREEWYAALALVKHKRYADRGPDVLPLYRHLIVTGAWWDVVDGVASHLVGPLLVAHPHGECGRACWHGQPTTTAGWAAPRSSASSAPGSAPTSIC